MHAPAILRSAALCAAAAFTVSGQTSTPPPHYVMHDLGTLGGASSIAFSLNEHGVVSGQAQLSNGTNHAVLWYRDDKLDIGTPGLSGPAGAANLNSTALALNNFSQSAGSAETPDTDPNGENFCSYGTGHTCKAFFWQSGRMTPFAGIDGPNSIATGINSFGQVTGVAETKIKDSSCPTVIAPTQTLQYKAFAWNPWQGTKRILPPEEGDTVSIGLWLNNKGQVIGQSGLCGNTTLPQLVVGPHAVLWDTDGSVIDMGNLGGQCLALCLSPLFGPMGNTPLYIDDEGAVVGTSVLAGEQAMHAFLWTKELGKMQDLGTLPGDAASVALTIDAKQGVVGISFDSSGNPRAFWRRDGQMLDVNTLVQANAPIYALGAFVINRKGEIAGFGVDVATGSVHGYLATPVKEEEEEQSHTWKDTTAEPSPKPFISDEVKHQMQQLIRNSSHLPQQ